MGTSKVKYRSRAWRWLVVGISLCPSLVLACSVNAGAISFAQINPLLGVAHYGSGVIDVTCPSLTSYSISLSAGQGSFASRHMTAAGHELLYNLYTGPSHQQVWGDGSGSSAQVSGEAGLSGNSHTVYGRLPAQSTARVGQYSDVITVTVSY